MCVRGWGAGGGGRAGGEEPGGVNDTLETKNSQCSSLIMERNITVLN